MRRYFLIQHQDKPVPYMKALMRCGYRRILSLKAADFLLIDFTISGLFSGGEIKIRPPVEQAVNLGIPIFLYPHSVRPNIPFDLGYREQNINALFTIAEGHKEVLRRIGVDFDVEVCGWPYSKIKPFMPAERKGLKILFAPIHPVGRKWLPDMDKELNKITYEMLGQLKDVSVSVRHISDLTYNGIENKNEAFRHYTSLPRLGSHRDISEADLIIGGFSLAYLAIALGKPVIMLGEGVVPHNTPRGEGMLILAEHWDKYKDYMHYPYNIEEISSIAELDDMIERAIKPSSDYEEWRKRFIGEPFNGDYFVKKLEGYL